jgi:hypothetical protein
LRERPGWTTDDLRGDGSEVGREAGTVGIPQQSSEIVVLTERELALNRALAQVSNHGAELFGIRARREEAVGPAVSVTERLRNPLEPDGERS